MALDANTGKRIWHYQTVHHDVWDYDNPPAPILVSIRKGKEVIDAVVQLTKMGLTFVLDRETGRPLFPTEEMAVPASSIEGEETWPTQPIPAKPLPLGALGVNESDLTNISPGARAAALKKFRKYLPGAFYTPPSEIGTLTSPGLYGGVEWHGGSFDPHSNILYVNANNGATVSKLRKIYDYGEGQEISELDLGRMIYAKNCVSCHGLDRKGVPPVYPGLLNLALSREETTAVIASGRKIMPAFSHFDKKELAVVAAYLESDSEIKIDSSSTGGRLRYLHEGYDLFTDDDGFPALAPPWGTLE